LGRNRRHQSRTSMRKKKRKIKKQKSFLRSPHPEKLLPRSKKNLLK